MPRYVHRVPNSNPNHEGQGTSSVTLGQNPKLKTNHQGLDIEGLGNRGLDNELG